MKSNSIDRGRAWLIAFACFWTHLTVAGIILSSGVLFPATVNSLNITREQASWPFTLGNIFAAIGISLSGLLLTLLSIRIQAVIACLICFFGTAFSYFAKDIISLSLLYGVINGLGEGLMNGTSLIIISQYFIKYRAIATGILFAGMSASCMVLPPLITYLIEVYGVKGCLLLLSGIALNGLPAALLYRPGPTFENNEHCESPIEGMKINIETSSLSVLMIPLKPSKFKIITGELKQWLRVFKYPMYYHITISFCMFCLCYYGYLLVIVDFEIDHGIDEETSAFLITIFSVFDLLGRLSIGWIIDFNFMKLRTILFIMHVLLGILYFTLPYCVQFLPLCFSAAFSGFVDGCIFTNWTVCINEYLHLSNLSGAIGTGAIFLGLGSVFMPFLIGFYRDIYHNYDFLFYTFGTIQCIIAVLWLLEPIFLKHQKKIMKQTEHI